jgi:signal transduction histidine kinase
MARRLMALQRQRLTESQVMDRRARRVLHDDVLPRLHTALLSLNSNGENEAASLLAKVHHQISDLLREIAAEPAPEVARLGLAAALQQVLQNELKDAFDLVQAVVTSEEAARQLPEVSALAVEVIFYAAREAMRNAALHARALSSAKPLHLEVNIDWQHGLRITIQDDGSGLPQPVRQALGAGGTGSTPLGSGQGLALHSTLMAVVGGSLALESVPGEYTRVVLQLPEG